MDKKDCYFCNAILFKYDTKELYAVAGDISYCFGGVEWQYQHMKQYDGMVTYIDFDWHINILKDGKTVFGSYIINFEDIMSRK